MSHPTLISNAFSHSMCGECHPLVNYGCYMTINSLHEWCVKIWVKMYPFCDFHDNVSLNQFSGSSPIPEDKRGCYLSYKVHIGMFHELNLPIVWTHFKKNPANAYTFSSANCAHITNTPVYYFTIPSFQLFGKVWVTFFNQWWLCEIFSMLFVYVSTHTGYPVIAYWYMFDTNLMSINSHLWGLGWFDTPIHTFTFRIRSRKI